MDPMTQLLIAREHMADLQREADRERLASIAREARRLNIEETEPDAPVPARRSAASVSCAAPTRSGAAL
jgi:hypothetical protein